MTAQWHHEEEQDDYGDCVKTEHYAVNSETGERINVDWSPYKPLDGTAFRLWVALGMPKRQGPAPLNTNDLMHLATRHLSRAAA